MVRGINVGGHKRVTMADLRALLSQSLVTVFQL